MVDLIDIVVESAFGMTLHHDLLAQADGHDKLMILLPGKGYTVDSPLFHYLRKVAVKNGWDVLSVTYAIHVGKFDDWLSRISDLGLDSMQSVNQAMERGYRKVCIVGKSLGTPIAGMIANALDVPEKAVLMLTPIQDAMTLIPDIRALGIIGTADPAYEPDMVKETATESWLVSDGLNHSLEYSGDWRKSLDILPEILEACEKFLQSL